MNFTKGEILKELLRLIASACRSGLLIADIDGRTFRERLPFYFNCCSEMFSVGQRACARQSALASELTYGCTPHVHQTGRKFLKSATEGGGDPKNGNRSSSPKRGENCVEPSRG